MLIMTTPLTPPVNRAIKSLATSLELARRRRGLSQADLAERMRHASRDAAGIALHPIQYVGEKLSGQTTALHVIARKR